MFRGAHRILFRKLVSKLTEWLRLNHEGRLPGLFRCAIPLVVIRVYNAIALGLAVTLSDGHGSVVGRKRYNLSEQMT